jgi:hypothetical protein
MWLFGGNGLDSAGSIDQYLNDLWKYSNGQWTWMGGSNLASQKGVYGTLGIPSPNNMPGAKENAVAWTDASGNASSTIYGNIAVANGLGWADRS